QMLNLLVQKLLTWLFQKVGSHRSITLSRAIWMLLRLRLWFSVLVASAFHWSCLQSLTIPAVANRFRWKMFDRQVRFARAMAFLSISTHAALPKIPGSSNLGRKGTLTRPQK